jgi:hypothetical protein
VRGKDEAILDGVRVIGKGRVERNDIGERGGLRDSRIGKMDRCG